MLRSRTVLLAGKEIRFICLQLTAYSKGWCRRGEGNAFVLLHLIIEIANNNALAFISSSVCHFFLTTR